MPNYRSYAEVHPGPRTREVAAELNRALRDLERITRLQVAAPLSLFEHPGGYMLTVQDEDLVVGEITGGTYPYSWREMEPDEEGKWQARDGGVSGTTQENPAYERNGNQQVQPGFIAVFYRGFLHDSSTDQEWIFDLDGQIPAKITSADGSTTTLSGALTDSATTVTVTSAANFPITNGFLFKVDDEVIKVTAGAGTTTWTVTRGADDTQAAAHADAATITHKVYSWTEQRTHPNGQWEDHPTARQGSPTDNPAYERNDNTRVPDDTFVLLFRHHLEARTIITGALTAGATSLTIADKHGFPKVSNFIVQIEDEKLLVTAGADSTSWTVTRGASGTTAAAHDEKAVVTLVSGVNGRAAHDQQWVFDYCCPDNDTRQRKTTDTTSGTKNSYTIPAKSEWHTIRTTGTTTINGFNRSSVENKRFQLTNANTSSDPITINHQSGSASASEQIESPSSQAFNIWPGETYTFKHDTNGTDRYNVERPAQLPQYGTSDPVHSARPGTSFTNTTTGHHFVNTDGGTTWSDTGPTTGVQYDRLSFGVYTPATISGNTTLTYLANGDAWNHVTGSGPYTITFFTPIGDTTFIGLRAATTLTGTVTLSGSFDTTDGAVSSLTMTAGQVYEFITRSSRWHLIDNGRGGADGRSRSKMMMLMGA